MPNPTNKNNMHGRNRSSGSGKGKDNKTRVPQAPREQAPRPPRPQLAGAWGMDVGSLVAKDDKEKADEAREEFIRMGGVGIRPSMQETFKDKRGQKLTQEYAKIGGGDIDDTEVSNTIPKLNADVAYVVKPVEMTASAANITEKSDIKVALPAEATTTSTSVAATIAPHEQDTNVTVTATPITTTSLSIVGTENECDAKESKTVVSVAPATTAVASPTITATKAHQVKTEVATPIIETTTWLPYPTSAATKSDKKKTTATARVAAAPAKKPVSSTAEFLANVMGQSIAIKTSMNAAFKRCDWKIKSVDEKLSKSGEQLNQNIEELRKIKVLRISPELFKAATDLPETKLQLNLAEFNRKQLAAENEKLKACSLERCKAMTQLKKENRELKRTVASAEWITEKVRMEQEMADMREQNDAFKKELDFLRWLQSVRRLPSGSSTVPSDQGSRSASRASVDAASSDSNAVELVTTLKVTKD